MILVDALVDVIFSPSDFFKNIKDETSSTLAWIQGAFFILIFGIFLKLIPIFFPSEVASASFLEIFGFLILVFIGNVIGFSITFFLFGGEGPFIDTFKILAYSTAIIPLIIISLCLIFTQFSPFGLLFLVCGSLYWIHILIRGGQFVHNLNYLKSFLAVLFGIGMSKLFMIGILVFLEFLYLCINLFLGIISNLFSLL